MREVLFRGKRKDNGEWFYGDLLQNIDVIKIREQEKEIKHIARSFVVSPETVGQFTGLTDKNGTKIFEGDIVNVYTRPHDISSCYRGKNLVIKFDEHHRFVASGNLEYPLCSHYVWEVIGNIHDNPELLRGED